MFAHVRATTEGSLSEDNCHPFCHGSLMWMHNGGLAGGARSSGGWASGWPTAGFLGVGRRHRQRVGVRAVPRHAGAHGPRPQRCRPPNGFGPTVLRRAMLRTIETINQLIDEIPESVLHADSVDTRSLLNFALTDGHTIICTRYVSSAADEAASLYYSSGSQWEQRPSATAAAADDRNYQMERRDKGAGVVLVASEPLTFERENWVNVPTNSILTIHGQTVMVHPIKDAYYDRSPYHVRSAAFVQTKGLAANEKSSSPASSSLAARIGRAPRRPVAARRRCRRRRRPGPQEDPRPHHPAQHDARPHPRGLALRQPRPLADAAVRGRVVRGGLVAAAARPAHPHRAAAPAAVRQPARPGQHQEEAHVAERPGARQQQQPGLRRHCLCRARSAHARHAGRAAAEQLRDPNKIAQYFPELNLSH